MGGVNWNVALQLFNFCHIHGLAISGWSFGMLFGGRRRKINCQNFSREICFKICPSGIGSIRAPEGGRKNNASTKLSQIHMNGMPFDSLHLSSERQNIFASKLMQQLQTKQTMLFQLCVFRCKLCKSCIAYTSEQLTEHM